MINRIWRSRLLLPVTGCFITLLFLLTTQFSSLAQQTPGSANVTADTTAAVAALPDIDRPFQDLGLEGSILIYDRKNDRTYEHNSARNSTQFVPASTFKIFNAMVALETGVIANDVQVLTWDGIDRGIAAWNRDTNLRQGFKDSAVWFYQVLARKAGHERMQKFVQQAGYGNGNIGTAQDIDRFWLQGPLLITAKQEIEFLQKLYREELPFSKRSIDLVKDIMIIEKTPGYTFRGKTGWIQDAQPEKGWLVGYLEQNDNVYFFATNIDMPKMEMAPLRLEVTRRCFKALGLM